MTSPEEVEVYAVGFVALSVCAHVGVPVEEVEAIANAEYPTGIRSRWKLARDENFAAGEPNPCPCERFPGERLHWLLNC